MTQRAEAVAETRRRIAAAAAALHEEVGPARTTVAAIAERAGVSRPTVYAQFPDDEALFRACSAHYRESHPLPGLEGLDLAATLAAAYAHYRENRRIYEHTARDLGARPALAVSLEPWLERLEEAVGRLASTERKRAVLRHALWFTTWHSLAVEHGLPDADVLRLMRALVDAA